MIDDPLNTLGKGGWPAELAAALLAGFGLVHGALVLFERLRHFIRPPVKSDREILSEDQDAFLERVMRRLEAVETKLDHCEASHAEMARKFNALLETAKIKGVELAMEMGSIAPIPPLDSINDGRKI